MVGAPCEPAPIQCTQGWSDAVEGTSRRLRLRQCAAMSKWRWLVVHCSYSFTSTTPAREWPIPAWEDADDAIVAARFLVEPFHPAFDNLSQRRHGSGNARTAVASSKPASRLVSISYGKTR